MGRDRSKGAMRAALAHRDFRLLLGGQAISNTGDWLYNISLIVYVLHVTHSGAWVAAASLARLLPYTLFGTFGGVIADRYDRKKVMIGADLARAAIMAGLATVAAAQGAAIAVIALAAASTIFSSAYLPAARAATPSLVGEDDLAAANSLVSTIENVALGLGPAIGGILLVLGSPAVAFSVNAVTFVVSAMFTILIHTSLVPTAAIGVATQSFGERLSAGFKAIGSSRGVKVLLAMSIALTIFYGQELVLYALASGSLFGIGDDGLAFVWAAIGIGGVLMAGVTSRIAGRPRQAAILGTMTVLSAIPIMLLAVVHPPALIYPAVAIEGAAIIVADVVFVTMLQRSVSGDVLGRVFGIMDSLMVAGILLGTVLAPLVVHVFSLEVALVAAGALVLVITALAWPAARVVDRETADRSALLAERIALLERTEIFEGASRTTIEGLAASAVREEVIAGTVMVREGDPADDLFVIESGSMRVTAHGTGVTEETLRELGPTDVFGEIGLIERMPRTATVTATTDCVLYRIAGDDFLRAVSEAPRMSGRLLSTIATRLARTHPYHGPGIS
jgi:predicted MFS family arabinose efflux permease